MSLRRRLYRLEQALPQRIPPAPEPSPEVDWAAIGEALLVGPDERQALAVGLDGPSRQVLEDLAPYAEAFQSFVRHGLSPDGPESRPGRVPEAQRP